MASPEKEREKMLRWKRKQPKGSIMKPETFKKIASSAKDEETGQRIAGAAYWRAVGSKYKKAKNKGGKPNRHRRLQESIDLVVRLVELQMGVSE